VIEINEERLIKVGFWCFLIIFISGIINYFMFFNTYNFWTKIGSGVGLVFNAALTLFFYTLLKKQSNNNFDFGKLEESLKHGLENLKSNMGA